MTDERLIAAARAYADAEYPETPLAPENEDYADIAVRAFLDGAVFEKAHTPTTPTDDELHALADVIEHVQTTWEADRDRNIEPLAEFTARGLLAAGFRRSEPSVEVVELKRQIARLETDLGQQIDRTEELHDIADRLSWAIAPMSEIGEHSSANDPWENAIEYAESRVWAEPQGEPSDAQVDAAGELLYGISWGTDLADPNLVREALRAAGGVR